MIFDNFTKVYQNTDRLLCHDDNIASSKTGRRIAYILYLSEDWKPEDGGALDLFSVNAGGNPDRVAKSLCPEWGQFV